MMIANYVQQANRNNKVNRYKTPPCNQIQNATHRHKVNVNGNLSLSLFFVLNVVIIT